MSPEKRCKWWGMKNETNYVGWIWLVPGMIGNRTPHNNSSSNNWLLPCPYCFPKTTIYPEKFFLFRPYLCRITYFTVLRGDRRRICIFIWRRKFVDGIIFHHFFWQIAEQNWIRVFDIEIFKPGVTVEPLSIVKFIVLWNNPINRE